jgi:hypothetical protein
MPIAEGTQERSRGKSEAENTVEEYCCGIDFS